MWQEGLGGYAMVVGLIGPNAIEELENEEYPDAPACSPGNMAMRKALLDLSRNRDGIQRKFAFFVEI